MSLKRAIAKATITTSGETIFITSDINSGEQSICISEGGVSIEEIGINKDFIFLRGYLTIEKPSKYQYSSPQRL